MHVKRWGIVCYCRLRWYVYLKGVPEDTLRESVKGLVVATEDFPALTTKTLSVNDWSPQPLRQYIKPVGAQIAFVVVFV